MRISTSGTRGSGQGPAVMIMIFLLAGILLPLTMAAGPVRKTTVRRQASRSPAALRATVQKAAPPRTPTTRPAESNDLAAQLDRALLPVGLKATLGACVQEVPSGKTLYEKNADEPMAPASNMKLLTTAVSLDLLGSDHKLQTRLVRNGDTLALIGGGDPAFGDPVIAEQLGVDRTADYARWVQALKDSGTAGEIRTFLYDDSIFDSEWRHPSWSDKEFQRWYAAPVGGLILNDSCVDVSAEATAGKTLPILTPACSLFDVVNRTTIGKGNQIIVGRPQGDWRLVLTGHFSGRTRPASVTVPDPGAFAAGVLYDMLKADVCPDLPAPQRKKITDASGNLPEGYEIVGTAESPLPDVLQRCNTNSQNHFAEALMKLNGALAGGRPGSWAAGRVALDEFLRKYDLPADGVHADDGSGLSKQNRVTARLLSSLLCRMREHPDWQTWRDSLAVGGENGTLRKRLKGSMESKVLAKTGFISGVSALSGYIEIGPDKYVAFSFLYNNISGWAGNARQAEDKACQVLYRQLGESGQAPLAKRK